MAIGTPQDLGQNSSASTPTSLAITTTQNVLTNDIIIVSHYANSGASTSDITSITDSSSNAYTKVLSQGAQAPLGEIYICLNAISMASSSTITVNFASNVALRHAVNAMRIPGLVNTSLVSGVWDVHTGQFEVSTAASSPNTAVNNYGAKNEIILGFFMSSTGATVFTAGTGFTALNSTAGGSAVIYTQYQIVSASAYTTNINNAASWTGSILHRGLSLGLIGS